MSFFANNAGWPLKPLKDVAHLKRGYDLPTQERIEGDIPIFAANGKNGTHNEAKIKGPGVVTGRSGTIGKVHFTEHDYWPLNTALYVTDFKGNDPKWVYYMLQAFKLERFVEGAGVPTLNRNLVHDELIPLPPLAEQKRIAAILDKADAIRRKRQQAIQLADDFLRAVFLEMFGDPLTNPKGGEVKKLGDLVSKPISYGILKPEEFVSGGIPMLRIQDLKQGYIDKSGEFHLVSERLSCQYNRTVLDGDEIVISLVGSIGIVAKVPLELRGANVHRNLGVIKLKDTSIAEFITSYMQLPHFMTILDRVTKGGVHKLLNLSDLREVEIPVPPIDLVGKFTELKFNVSHLKLLNETFRKEMAFESLSQKAFSGQL